MLRSMRSRARNSFQYRDYRVYKPPRRLPARGRRDGLGSRHRAATTLQLRLLPYAATIGLLVRGVEAVQQAEFIWLFPLTFASSAFVQTDGMPGPLRAFADHKPLTQIIDAVRGLLLDQPVGSAGWQALAWCVGIHLVFVPLSISLYRRVATR